jgi:hypothetical protein
VYAVYPNTRHLPAKVGMFMAFLREYIGRRNHKADTLLAVIPAYELTQESWTVL